LRQLLNQARERFAQTLGGGFSLTGQLRDREGRGGHLAAVGALGAGAERATALTQLRPLTVAVDEDAALIEDAVEKERRVFLDPDKMREIDPAAADPLQTGGQVESGNEAIAGERDQQVQVGVRVVVAASQRAVEHGETDAALGPMSSHHTPLCVRYKLNIWHKSALLPLGAVSEGGKDELGANVSH
jgi:hypothetical protein